LKRGQFWRSARSRPLNPKPPGQKVRHFNKLSTSQSAYFLLKPYFAWSWITRSSLFLTDDKSRSDKFFHLCRISSRIIRLPSPGAALRVGFVNNHSSRCSSSNSSNLRIAPQVQHEHEEVHERLGVGAKLASYTRFGARRPPGLQYSSGGPSTG
jgi:hypothetical protein